MSFQNRHIAAIGEKKSPGLSASIGGKNRLRLSLATFAGDRIRRDRRIKSPGVSLALEIENEVQIALYQENR